MASLDTTREVPAVIVRSVFKHESVEYTGTDYVGPPGLAAFYANYGGGGTGGLIFCCPGDGKVRSIGFEKIDGSDAWTWNGDREKPTCKPSILCNPDKGGCGWHGWLTAGRFQLSSE